MKKLLRNPLHMKEGSNDCIVVEISGKKFKMTYEAYNAGETFTVEMFTDIGWKFLYSIKDLGFMPNKSAWHLMSAGDREKRVNEIIKNAQKAIELLLK